MNEMKGSREQEIERSREHASIAGDHLVIAGAGGAHDFEFKWHKMDENRYLQKRKLFLRNIFNKYPFVVYWILEVEYPSIS